jgi:hypothetical protein
MKNKIARSLVFALFTIVLLSCSGKDNSGGSITSDTMTVTVTDLSSTLTSIFTEGSYTTSPQGFSYIDPSLDSYVTPANKLGIELRSGMSLSNAPAPREAIIIGIDGNATGTYSIDATGLSYISYLINDQLYASYFSSSPSGTIVISSIGNVGEKITGSFDALVTRGSLTPSAGNADTRTISGTFSVTRTH